jgi:adenylate cyclase class IV
MSIEVELKALTSNLEEVQAKIESKYDISCCTKTYSEQLNHYFTGDKKALKKLLFNYDKNLFTWNLYELTQPHEDELVSASKLAVRSRWDSVQGTLLIFKYSLIDENSVNGTTRKELEFPLDVELTELDNYLLECGFTYQSKWSRKRTQYSFDSGWNLCLDENAGFGSILEVEYVATEEEYAAKKDYLMYKAKTFLDTLGLVELEASLLEQMFNFYSSRYDEFYGTDKLIWDDTNFLWNRQGNLKQAPNLLGEKVIA